MKKHALTAVALTAALTLGTAPAAFAAAGVGNLENKTLQNEGDTGTTVKVETTVSQISVQLPLTLTIATPTKGGTTSVPSADSYKIVNQSIFPIKVSNATAVAQEDWTLKSDPLSDTSTPAGAAGDLQMTITPKSGTAWNVANAYAEDSWKIPANAVGGSGSELTFTIAATNSPLKKTFSSATKAVTLTYTVAADDAAPVA